ncbi:succinylglutamate desuccinylase [Xylophilus sp. Kf1]|nr:succinylglutamate desuccinylase [Xylophilus sp. Kf1]
MEFLLEKPDIGALTAGNTGTRGVWRFDSGQAGRHVLITALVHGNELCGAWALKGLLEAGVQPQRGRLTLMFCNLDAFDTFDPLDHDPSRFVEEDMNRQWSPERLASAETLERRRAQALAPFVDEADWLLDLHSMHEPGLPLALVGLSPHNEALAVAMGAPETIVADAGHKDGVRMRDFGRFGTDEGIAAGARSILVECGFHGDPASRAVAEDQCFRFLALSGIVDAETLETRLPGWRLPDAAQQWLLEVTGGVVATGRDVRFVEPYQGLEVIAEAGTVIGHDAGVPIVTPYADCVLVMPSVRQARQGVTVVRFARRRPARG